jgi:magnesium transporter
MKRFRILYADDDTSSVKRLILLRAPSILLGLLLGILLSFVFSRFEEVLAKDIRVAFFIPFVVYIAAAVGAQTQSIFARDLKTGHASFKKYFAKEISVGFILGIVSALLSSLIAYAWFREPLLACVVGLSMLISVSIAPLVALVVTESLQIEHLDPAVGAGPIATVIQDTLSVLIYGSIASYILL